MGLKFNPFTRTFDFTGSGSSPGGGGNVHCPTNVIFVDVNGNDTHGDGSCKKPFQTAQKAVDVALALYDDQSILSAIQLGVGDFGNITITGDHWRPEISIFGQGIQHSIVSTLTILGNSGQSVIRSNKTVFFDSILSFGVRGEDGVPGEPSANGGPGGPGGDSGALHLFGIVGNNVFSIGGSGGDGGKGGDSEDPEADGGNGGEGGQGGSSGDILLYDSFVRNVSNDEPSGGYGGAAGSGFAGGPDGNPGEDGPGGTQGNVFLYHSSTWAVTGYNVHLACSIYENIAPTNTFDDYGGNAQAPFIAP